MEITWKKINLFNPQALCEREYTQIVDARIKRKKKFCKLRDEAGGFEDARSANDIPSSLDQIYDISRK